MVPLVTSAENSRARALRLPEYDATFPSAIRRFFVKYVTFTGRAGRAEYWWWFLVAAVVPVAIQLASALIVGNSRQPQPVATTTLLQLFAIATLVPELALTWRRLHDTNRSGLWCLFGLVPLVGWILLFIFLVQSPDPRGERYDAPAT